MPTINVTYNDEIRQFAVSSHSTWAELSSTLRAIFAIHPSTKIELSYTDEDDDVVIMSSDLELGVGGVFDQRASESGPMKFTLIITDEEIEQNEEDGVVIPNNTHDRNSIGELSEKGWVLEGVSGHEIVVNKDKSEDDVNSCDGEFENIDEDKKSVDIESRSENDESYQEQSIPLLYDLSRAEVDTSSEEEEEETEPRETEIPPSSPQPSASNSNPTLDDLTQQLQSLVNQFQDFFTQNPQIMETANRLIHDVVDSVKGDAESFGEWLKDMKRQIEENILRGMDVDANRNRNMDTSETSQYAYTPTYTPARSDDGQARRGCPFLSGMPGNTLNTNNEERSPKDELPRQHGHPYHANPSHRHHSHPPLSHPHHLPGHPRPSHNLSQSRPSQSPPSHFTSDSYDHPNLPSSLTAPPPPPPPPPVPQLTQEQQETQPETVPYINGLFRNLGTRLFPSSGTNNDSNDDTTDDMSYSPSYNSPRFFAYQSPDGDIRCGRGPFGGPRIGNSEYPGYSGSFGNIMDDDDDNVNKADKTQHTNNKHLVPDIDDQNIQDFQLAPDDLLNDIRILRDMGFNQPTRELENLFRRNNDKIDDVINILVEQAENRY